MPSRGDRVAVLTGKDAGKQGRVITVLPAKGRVLVAGINRVKRHEKIRPARGRQGQEGGIVTKELPVNISNLALICPSDGPTRAGVRINPDGTKVRICVKCQGEI
jgi:large subunit ribosomal protein L24